MYSSEYLEVKRNIDIYNTIVFVLRPQGGACAVDRPCGGGGA